MASTEQIYAERYAVWAELHRRDGPARSYPYAWRLPELARPLGRPALLQAQHALALDLYTLGRFEEALAALPERGEVPGMASLGRRLDRMLDRPGASADAAQAPSAIERASLAYLTDRPQDFPQPPPDHSGEPPSLLHELLHGWAQARAGHTFSPTVCHRALLGLRQSHPAQAAEGEAVFAETVFWQGARWSVVWLDHALDQVELYGQHHAKARLLYLKARALEAGGELAEGARFRKLGRALADRQGARLYQHLFFGEA